MHHARRIMDNARDLNLICRSSEGGTDVTWTGSEWRSMYREGTDDDAYRTNSYRVLLTRGRDGFIVFIPKEEELDAVAEVFSEIGIKEL